ncbi:MAG: LPS-assembly protein LptD [Allosphingosinicella sp.]|uniref:LPS-assembly protein LptD n=1 Tax=Allosphingosinicella sp. TaxID=2823234 RepID=UPI003928A90B
MNRIGLICRTALPLLLCTPYAAAAQPAPRPAAPAPAPAPGEVDFSADRLVYDEAADLVTATGEVRMRREGYNLSADEVSWNRRTGAVTARGNVRIVSPGGDIAYGDSVELTDTLRDGVVANLLIVLEDGGRLAAIEGRRQDGVTTLTRAAYSPCAVLDEDGCPKEPTWQINAVRVVHDPARRRIYYEGANLNLFGRPIVGLPGLSHPDGSAPGGTGFLVPDVRISRSNGVEVRIPYYIRLAPNRDVTVAPHVFSGVAPMLEAEYRELNRLGAYQVRGFLTYGSRVPLDPVRLVPLGRDEGIRAYLEGNGRYQLDPLWSVTGSLRYVTDRTFLRRYDISRDDRLRSMVNAERVTRDSYVSIAGWAFQGLRIDDAQGQQPVVLPVVDARWRLEDPFWDGRIELQANSMSLLRTEGQDTQRAFASARWDRRGITAWGQELVLTGYVRGDVYHANDTLLTQTAIYRGREGWSGRAIGAIAADLRWPLVGEFMGGTQRLTPRLQFVASPPTENMDIPNEDARAVDLEDSNLFALNRFPGYDRWEDGVRLTYGADWALDLPGISFRSTVGQSYRLNRRPTILPPGTGLSDRFSDIVGRTNLRVGRRLNFVHRFRVDKDNLAVRRNEVDATFGSSRTYVSVGYLRLNRNIDTAIEDLRDREEIRLGGRVQVARHWSLFGSAVVDLTGPGDDPRSLADGFQPVRHRLGILYNDDCIELGVTWRRDYETTGDVRRGNTFLFRVALRNLGR